MAHLCLLPVPWAVAILGVEALAADLLELVLTLALLLIGHDAPWLTAAAAPCNDQSIYCHAK
jgi:hypothetical protein